MLSDDYNHNHILLIIQEFFLSIFYFFEILAFEMLIFRDINFSEFGFKILLSSTFFCFELCTPYLPIVAIEKKKEILFDKI